jgi:hypothetical protein
MNDKIDGRWTESIRAFINTVRGYFKAGVNAVSIPVTCKEVAGLERAIRTIRMAANPGEDYWIVAARVEREAASFRAFLRNPQPIGKITLNVKQLDCREANLESLHQQYQVYDPATGHSDPAEGKASVLYTYNRSNDKVLEFVVHDKNDTPLFPIARTYSNWVGTKAFDLGCDRTFHLSMVEESPGYVTVQAGFMPPRLQENTNEAPQDQETEMQQAEPHVKNEVEPLSKWFSFLSVSSAKRLAVITAECVVVSLICCTIFWKALTSSGKLVIPATAQTSSSSTIVAGSIGDEMAQESNARGSSEEALAGQINTGGNNASAELPHDSKLRAKAELPGAIKRLAKIQAINIAVDNSSCGKAMLRCHGLLISWQKEMKSRLNNLNFSTLSTEQAHTDQELFKLVVSYKPVDLQHGHIHLTLYDIEGPVWNGNHDVNYGEAAQSQLVAIYLDEASRELVDDINRAKEQQNSGMDEKGD